MKVAILNTSIVTCDGEYRLSTISLEHALEVVRGAELDSAVGHQSTAEILSELLGMNVPVNRQQFAQEPKQHALVFKLKGRPPEGKILSRDELEQIGYVFQLLTRLA